MARAKARSNIYAFMPFLACVIMGVGIYFTIDRIQDYRGPAPEPDPLPPLEVPEVVQPEQPKVEQPVVEEPAPGVEEEPAAPDEGEKGAVAPDEGGEEGVAPAPGDEGAKKKEKAKPEEEEEEEK